MLSFFHPCTTQPVASIIRNLCPILYNESEKKIGSAENGKIRKQKEKVLEVGFEPTTVAFLSIASNDPDHSTTQAGNTISTKL